MAEETKALSLETYSAERAEVAKMAEQYKGLEIKGVEDKKGYAEVDAARKALKAARVRVQKTGKELRDDANKFAKKVIEVEKDIVALIEPTEKDLAAKQEAIDVQRERLRRVEILPERKARLAELGADAYSDEQLLDYDDNEFEQVVLREQAAKLEREKAELEEQRRKLEKEKKEAEEKAAAAEAEKKRLEDLEKARLEAAEQAKKEAEAEKQRAITAERERAENEAARKAEAEKEKLRSERIKLIEEVEFDGVYITGDLADLTAEQFQKLYNDTKAAKEKKETEEKAAAEAAEKERLEKRKKYTTWLAKNGYTEETKEQFKIERDGNAFTLWKKVSDVTI